MTTKLRWQVQEFNRTFGIKRRLTPGVPPDEVIRLHLGMCVEEILELVEACVMDSGFTFALSDIHDHLKILVERAPIKINLPKAADALGDSDYVNESFRDALGIDGEPIADCIHGANMSKAHTCASCHGSGGGLDDTDCYVCNGTGRVVRKNDAGKVQKPEGFKPPDIEGELRKQGWKPNG